MRESKTCYYCLPEYSHGRRVIWDCIDNAGFPLLSHIPEAVIKRKSRQEMTIEFVNGSIFQLVGADSYDRLVGSNPKIVVFSEYAITNPRAWDFLRPILESPENAGTAIWASTPRGRNHFYDLYKVAEGDQKSWFCQTVTNSDTRLLSDSDIDRLRREGMSEDLIQQEFYCSFAGTMEGSYYGRYLAEAEREGRIGTVAYDPQYLVNTAWDIGIGDSMVVTYFQVAGDGTVRVIDHYEHSGYPLPHYIQELKAKPYLYGKHLVPHDGRNRSVVTGSTFVEAAAQLGIVMDIVPCDNTIEEGIEAVRGLFPRLQIDARKCEHLIKCLQGYAAEYDDRAKMLRTRPSHNWASHSADSVRMMALAIKKGMLSSRDKSDWGNIKEKYNYYSDLRPQSPHSRILR